ncbi:MAG: hypothetical protein PVF85_07535 [Anaerolineales bacterium]|jgi:hypothetical protein
MSQNMKEQLSRILEASKQADQEFLENLTDADRSEASTYQEWSAKDVFAHAHFWQRYEADKILEWLETGSATPGLQFEQSNLKAYDQFKESSWEEILEYSEETSGKMQDVLDKISAEILLGPSWESEERKMWESLVQRLYSHKLFHYAELYQKKGQNDLNSRLWSEWAELVSPLDPGDSWQGRVHYNAACGLALAGEDEGALRELRKSLELMPTMKTWARLDGDLDILHDSEQFKLLITEDYWWKALEADPQTEAVADQFIRALTMLRNAVKSFPDSAWLEGETNYLRPVALGLHIAQSIGMFSSQAPGDVVEHALMQVNWESTDSTLFPDKLEFLDFLDVIEEKLALFLAAADLDEREDHFPWTGSSKLSRTLYALRHTQHHLADMATVLHRSGLRPPDWA